MPTYGFRCECGVVTEARRGVEVTYILCLACGGKAKREMARVALLRLPTRGSLVSTAALAAAKEKREWQT